MGTICGRTQRYIHQSGSDKYGKTAAQTALRFLLQNDVVIIPKSVHKDRMQQNFDLFDFTLTAEEMAEIEVLDGGENFH